MTTKTQTDNSSVEDYLEDVREDPTHRNYWHAYKKIQQLDLPPADEKKQLNITLLSSFTVDLLATYLDIDSRLIGLSPEVYVGPFNQYQQEILDDDSKLYQFESDLIIFNIHLPSLMSKNFEVEYPQLDKDQILEEKESILSSISHILKVLSEKTDALILFSNFIVPTFSTFGVLDNKQEIGYQEFYREINNELFEQYEEDSQIYIFDLDNVAASFGKSKVTDNTMYYRGTILFSKEFLPHLSHAYSGYIKALKNLNRKAIVLDLDNTLWGGIIGEDGMDGIKLDKAYPGKEFVDFQKLLLSYYNRGIILAINSKNNFDDAYEVIKNHPHMVLEEDHFAAMKINWQDKVQNIIEIAEELNIGIDSLVFVDDNPVERERVRQSLPQVKVVEMPEKPVEYVDKLKELEDFNTFSLTREDLNRGEMYVARRKRKDLKQDVQSMENFIESLQIKAHIGEASKLSLPRVTSLVNRTNQFNTMTQRFTENQIRDFYEQDGPMKIYTLQVTDKFGDEGIVGVAMIDTSEDTWEFENFLMSCRVIGRNIETCFIYKILNDALDAGASAVIGHYIPTKKNDLVKDFWDEHKFELDEKNDDGSTKWIYEPNEKLDYPDYIEVVTDE